MTRGNRPAASRAPSGTSHHPDATDRTVEIVEQVHSDDLVRAIAAEIPDGTPRAVFLRAVEELGGRVRDTDLEALRIMAVALHNYGEAQQHIARYGTLVASVMGNLMPNPALKVARDEANLYLKIADQYALTFVSRLRAGLLQLAGQSMLQQLHDGVAGAIVERILELPPDDRLALSAASTVARCQQCGRTFKTSRGLAAHVRRAHPS